MQIQKELVDIREKAKEQEHLKHHVQRDQEEVVREGLRKWH